MYQQFEGKQTKLTAAEKRQVILRAAHLLNKLRSYADEVEAPLTASEENDFWNFICSLPANDQSSVIN